MSELSREDQAALRQAEIQRFVENASAKIIQSSTTTIQDLQRVMESRFSKAHEDLKLLSTASHGMELAITRTQAATATIEREVAGLRRDVDRELAQLASDQKAHEDRLRAIEKTQATRENTYQMMNRVILYVVMAFVATVASLVFVRSD